MREALLSQLNPLLRKFPSLPLGQGLPFPTYFLRFRKPNALVQRFYIYPNGFSNY